MNVATKVRSNVTGAGSVDSSKSKIKLRGKKLFRIGRKKSDGKYTGPKNQQSVNTANGDDEVKSTKSDAVPSSPEISSSLRSEEDSQDILAPLLQPGKQLEAKEERKSMFSSISLDSFRLASMKESIVGSVRKWLFTDDADGISLRRQRSMMGWANKFRFSSKRERVTPNSHFIATTENGRLLENILMPIIPSSTESLVTFLLFFSAGLVIPFGITRMRTGRWTGYLPFQALINWVMVAVGLQPMFGGNTQYLEYASDEHNAHKGIDLAFGLHIVWGVLWIIFGGIQIVSFKKWSRRLHRRFGYFTTGIFLMHTLGAVHILYRDIVHHHPFVKALLFHDMVASMCYILGGIKKAIDGDVETHKDMLLRGYLHAIEGSGTIRFTGWVLWMIGQNCSPELRVFINTAACQSQYVTAAATKCVFPYVFRLQSLRILTLYFNGLYLRTPEKARDKSSRMLLNEEITEAFKFLLQSMVYVFVVFHVGSFEVFRDTIAQGEEAQLLAMGIYTSLMIMHRSSHVRKTLLLPRRNAVRESTAGYAAEVARWEGKSKKT